ncbi:MAG: hypothetical protein A2328_10130 [Bdellovibrionales bacterium RIFOXYB2_FULL_36_6]|nr:MAG: hypothetical protein A2328_10130 [Bdellovibrionales bacterium RIFOXYB2_FULL_36_6]
MTIRPVDYISNLYREKPKGEIGRPNLLNQWFEVRTSNTAVLGVIILKLILYFLLHRADKRGSGS